MGMPQQAIAQASTKIHAPAEVVWNALTNPEAIKRYMFGTHVISDWHVGHPITWQGESKGRQYVDKGVILAVRPLRLLSYSHYSPLSGVPDVPENYHRVTIELEPEGPDTGVTLTQDGNRDEEARAHSEENWKAMLRSLKELLELSYASYPAGAPSYFNTSKR